MKLLVQGDDFGFTRAVTYGIVDSIDYGILRNTGLFTNMPCCAHAVSFMQERPHVCFGIDFNIVSGPSVCEPGLIPHLVDEHGNFIRSGLRVKDPMWQSEEGRSILFPYEEVLLELWAQYDRFVELTGRKPGYLHSHSLMSENYLRVIRRISRETGVPYSHDITEKYRFVRVGPSEKERRARKKEFDPIMQLCKDSIASVLSERKTLLGADYVLLGGHPGYVDQELLDLSTLSLERMKDAEMCMSKLILDWVRENNVELITYYDLQEA